MIKLAVFGRPVVHSLSPRIHRLFAAQFGIGIDYRAIEASPESFPGQLAELARNGGLGCNITVPLKSEAWKLSSRCSEAASRAQAANTLVFRGEDDWYADSTDGMGLVNDLQFPAGCRLRGARVCLLGAGGAAASVLGALLQAQPESLMVANRTAERAAVLARRHADLGPVGGCMPSELGAGMPFDLIINATSLGHAGETPELSPSWLAPDGICYDMNYGDAAEPLRRFCRENNMAYSDGLGMLVGQAALSFRLWTGHEPELAPVLEELRGSTG